MNITLGRGLKSPTSETERVQLSSHGIAWRKVSLTSHSWQRCSSPLLKEKVLVKNYIGSATRRSGTSEKASLKKNRKVVLTYPYFARVFSSLPKMLPSLLPSSSCPCSKVYLLHTSHILAITSATSMAPLALDTRIALVCKSSSYTPSRHNLNINSSITTLHPGTAIAT